MKQYLLPLFGGICLLLLTIAAVNDFSGTTRYRQGAILSFDSQVTLKDEDGNWSFNGSNLQRLTNAASFTSTAYFITGTTNQIQFGSTNVAPANTNVILWVSVQVSGDTNAYRIGLMK